MTPARFESIALTAPVVTRIGIPTSCGDHWRAEVTITAGYLVREDGTREPVDATMSIELRDERELANWRAAIPGLVRNKPPATGIPPAGAPRQ